MASPILPAMTPHQPIEDLLAHYRKLVATDDAAATLVLAHVNEKRDPPIEQLLDTESVAQILNVSRKLVQELAQKGCVRCVKVGRLVRFKRAWIEDFMTPKRAKSRHW